MKRPATDSVQTQANNRAKKVKLVPKKTKEYVDYILGRILDNKDATTFPKQIADNLLVNSMIEDINQTIAMLFEEVTPDFTLEEAKESAETIKDELREYSKDPICCYDCLLPLPNGDLVSEEALKKYFWACESCGDTDMPISCTDLCCSFCKPCGTKRFPDNICAGSDCKSGRVIKEAENTVSDEDEQ